MEDIHTFLIVVICFHCCIYFIDTIFKTCMLLPYFSLLHNTGFEIKPFRLHWYTTTFNRLIHKWGSTRPKLILAWFSTGSWVTISLMPLALVLLVRSIYLIFVNLIFEDKSSFSNVGTLQPMVPGLNIPLSEVGYYLITLLICTVVHEMGHAIAAVSYENTGDGLSAPSFLAISVQTIHHPLRPERAKYVDISGCVDINILFLFIGLFLILITLLKEDGRVNGVGVVVLFCVPVAYVSIDSLELMPCARQLRVLCAGVWHNVVLAAAALCTMLATPWLLLPLYDWGSGAQIQTVQQQSPVFGVGGLMERDLVIQVNECFVTDVNSWQNCLAQAARLSTPGHCLTSEFIKEHDESVPVWLHSKWGTKIRPTSFTSSKLLTKRFQTYVCMSFFICFT